MTIIKNASALALALALGGCASLTATPPENLEFVSPEQSASDYACAAFLMGVDAPGPVPVVYLRDGMWMNEDGEWVNGEYFPGANLALVRRFYDTEETTVHELTHALQKQRDEAFNQFEADKAERWLRDCRNFGGMYRLRHRPSPQSMAQLE